MATAKWYGNAHAGQYSATAARRVDWVTDTIKAALCTSSYTPNQDTHTWRTDQPSTRPPTATDSTTTTSPRWPSPDHYRPPTKGGHPVSTKTFAVERRHLHGAATPASIYTLTGEDGEQRTFQVPELRTIIAPTVIEERAACPACGSDCPDGAAACPECGAGLASAGLHFRGHAAVFDSASEDLGGFTEYVARGAFKRALDRHPDVRALFNHDPNYVLGRTKSKTLDLREDPRGLHYYVVAPDVQYARDLRTLMLRGDIDQSSFAFTVERDKWVEQDGKVTRTIHEIRDLYDVSVVTVPAYPEADASARTYPAEPPEITPEPGPEALAGAGEDAGSEARDWALEHEQLAGAARRLVAARRPGSSK